MPTGVRKASRHEYHGHFRLIRERGSGGAEPEQWLGLGLAVRGATDSHALIGPCGVALHTGDHERVRRRLELQHHDDVEPVGSAVRVAGADPPGPISEAAPRCLVDHPGRHPLQRAEVDLGGRIGLRERDEADKRIPDRDRLAEVRLVESIVTPGSLRRISRRVVFGWSHG